MAGAFDRLTHRLHKAEKALKEAEPFLAAGRNPYLVHVGSGIPVLGERREDVLAKRIPDGVRYIGVAVGKRWSRNFMKRTLEARQKPITIRMKWT